MENEISPGMAGHGVRDYQEEKLAKESRDKVQGYLNEVGASSGLKDYIAHPSLLYKAQRGLERASAESRLLGLLHQELFALTQKHPDIARMLDLIKILGY